MIDVSLKVNFLVPGASDHRKQGWVSACPECRVSLPQVFDAAVQPSETVHLRRVLADECGDDAVVHTVFAHYQLPVLVF